MLEHLLDPVRLLRLYSRTDLVTRAFGLHDNILHFLLELLHLRVHLSFDGVNLVLELLILLLNLLIKFADVALQLMVRVLHIIDLIQHDSDPALILRVLQVRVDVLEGIEDEVQVFECILLPIPWQELLKLIQDLQFGLQMRHINLRHHLVERV